LKEEKTLARGVREKGRIVEGMGNGHNPVMAVRKRAGFAGVGR